MKWAVAATILVAAMAVLPGCGLGAGSQEGMVDLLVTRDYGNEVLVNRSIGDLTQSETALRILDGATDIETRYGGGFVQSVEGISGGNKGGRSSDWFFAVNGIVAERGSAEFDAGAGDQVWWDYRDWTDAMEIGAVVGSFPAPMAGGYDDRVWPVVIQCVTIPRDNCAFVQRQLGEVGVEAAISNGVGSPSDDTLRILVGRWTDMQLDSDALNLRNEPSRSGVFAQFVSTGGADHLLGLDRQANEARDYGPDAGLVAASRHKDGPPVWFITGGSDAGVEAAASALTTEDLQHRYAAVVSGGQIASLPLP